MPTKLSSAFAAAFVTLGLVAAPMTVLAHETSTSCVAKPIKATHKAKSKKAAVHKTKAKATSKAKTIKVAHKTKPKTKVITVAAPPCDCKTEVRIVKVVEPPVEHNVTVYRAEPRKWRAPYVDEVMESRSEHNYEDATYAEDYRESSYSEETHEERSYSYSDRSDYLSVDTRPGRHKHTRWSRWQ